MTVEDMKVLEADLERQELEVIASIYYSMT
jgi:hypothetical protein